MLPAFLLFIKMTNAQIKLIKSLKDKKYRNQHGLFVVEGRKTVEELLKSDFQTVNVYAVEAWQTDELKQQLGDKLITVTQSELERISNQTNPEGVIATVRQNKNTAIASNDNLILALDNINNPGNLGTIIRLAVWFGIKDIVCDQNTVDCYNPKVLQSTMGAIFHVNLLYTDLSEFLKDRQYEPVYGTVLQNGKNIYKENLTDSGIIIIGNESHGISDEILKYINRPVTVPSFACAGGAESLNASVACGIILSEFRRRQ